jgi:hypothetical protein
MAIYLVKANVSKIDSPLAGILNTKDHLITGK